MLKDRGHAVSLFDSTGYDLDGKVNPDDERARMLFNKPIDPASDQGVKFKTTNIWDDLDGILNDFEPTVLAMTVTESTFLRGVGLLNYIRETHDRILSIVGGVFPTFAPKRVIREDSIDIVCVGEGEMALLELCERLDKNRRFDEIPNLWVKKQNGEIVKNRPGVAVDINSLPPIDFSIFEENRFYRPMRGQVYRMLPVETHRGCPYTCSFCNSPAQNSLYNDQAQSMFFRKKSVDQVRIELELFRNQWNGEYVFFWADTFLAWSQNELDEFCEMYSEFRFPFWCQSRPETVSDKLNGYKKLERLQNVGLHHMSFGMEHGSEKFRREVIKRNYKNEDALAALKNPVKLGIPITINNIIGFPDETRDLAMEKVAINREIDSFNANVSTFAPYQGTELRTLAEQRGYINSDVITPSNIDHSILKMPNFSKEEIFGLQRTFLMYVKFPKSRGNEIKMAEKMTVDGEKVWESLRLEYEGKYFKEPTFQIDRVND